MDDTELKNRLIDLEMAIDNQAREIDDLNDVVIKQGKLIDLLLKQQEYLKSILSTDIVKPQNEETPPPHY